MSESLKDDVKNAVSGRVSAAIEEMYGDAAKGICYDVPARGGQSIGLTSNSEVIYDGEDCDDFDLDDTEKYSVTMKLTLDQFSILVMYELRNRLTKQCAVYEGYMKCGGIDYINVRLKDWNYLIKWESLNYHYHHNSFENTVTILLEEIKSDFLKELIKGE